MEAVLDFAYGSELAATTESATALLHLAQYFRGKAVHAAAAEFVKGDLNSRSAPTYLAEASIYGMQQITAEAVRLCAENLGARDRAPGVGDLDDLEPELFLRVLQSPALKCDSLSLSMHVASFCHGKTVDADLLRSLTPATLMPEIDPEAALPLLQLALQHNPAEPQPGLALRERCVRAASGSFRKVFGKCAAAADSPAARISRTHALHRCLQVHLWSEVVLLDDEPA